MQRETGSHRAVKIVKRKELKKRDGNDFETKEEREFRDQQNEMEQMSEIELLCSLVHCYNYNSIQDHPNIVRVHETYIDEEKYYIVME